MECNAEYLSHVSTYFFFWFSLFSLLRVTVWLCGCMYLCGCGGLDIVIALQKEKKKNTNQLLFLNTHARKPKTSLMGQYSYSLADNSTYTIIQEEPMRAVVEAAIRVAAHIETTLLAAVTRMETIRWRIVRHRQIMCATDAVKRDTLSINAQPTTTVALTGSERLNARPVSHAVSSRSLKNQVKLSNREQADSWRHPEAKLLLQKQIRKRIAERWMGKCVTHRHLTGQLGKSFNGRRPITTVRPPSISCWIIIARRYRCQTMYDAPSANTSRRMPSS